MALGTAPYDRPLDYPWEENAACGPLCEKLFYLALRSNEREKQRDDIALRVTVCALPFALDAASRGTPNRAHFLQPGASPHQRRLAPLVPVYPAETHALDAVKVRLDLLLRENQKHCQSPRRPEGRQYIQVSAGSNQRAHCKGPRASLQFARWFTPSLM